MRNVKQITEELDAKRQQLADIFAKAKDEATGELKMSQEQVDDVRHRNQELTDLGVELEGAREVDEIYQKNRQAIQEAGQPGQPLPLGGHGKPNPPQASKTLGELFVEHKAYKNRQHGHDLVASFPEVDMKTLMSTSAGFAPQAVRTGRVIESAQRRPIVADVIPQTTTDQAAIVFMEETTFTNAAAAAAEGGAYGEGALAFTERSDTVRKIATFLPVTDEQMEDIPQMQALIDNRLMLMLALTEEVQLLTGSGVAPNLTGYLVKSGVQTQAKGADPVPDAIYKAMTLVRHTGFADPTAVIFHPNDWQDVRLLRTVDGIYIWGSPAEAGPERIWGLPVVVTTAETENTALVGDFQLYSQIFRKRGVDIKVSDSHSDYFVNGKQAIRADERLALAIYRAAAFCKVTGI